MYSYTFFKENDTLTKFMNICIEKYNLIPDISLIKSERVMIFSGRNILIGVTISNDPVCIKITSIECNQCCDVCCSVVISIIKDLMECAKWYNVVIGVWAEDIDVPIYKNLGFKVIEIAEKVWLEYTQLLH